MSFYLGNIANQQRKQAARDAAEAARLAVIQAQQGGGAGTALVGGVTVNLPAPVQAAPPTIAESIGGFFSNLSPPVMIVLVAGLAIVLMKRK